MRVLPINQDNDILIIPRDYSSNSETYNITLTSQNGVSTFDINEALDSQSRLGITIPSFGEGEEVTLRVEKDNEIMFKGMLFFTAQAPQNYNINE